MTRAAPKPASVVLERREADRIQPRQETPEPARAPAAPARRAEAECGPCDGVPRYRERLLPLIFGRLSFAYYRASRRYHRHQALVGRENTLPVPLLIDSLSIYLCRRLPAPVVARLGPGGVRRLAELVERVMHGAGATARAVLRPFVRALRGAVRWRRRRAERRAQVRAHFLERSPVAGPRTMFASCFALDGHEVRDRALTLYWRSVRRFPEPCQIFVHLFPENPECLPEDRRIHGYFFKDHAPAMDVADWPRRRTYRDEVSLHGIPPGYYRLLVGLVQVRGVRRLPVDGTGQNGAELGWIRIP